MTFQALTTFTTTLALLAFGDAFSWTETTALLAFGDSYTFVQGTSGYPAYSFIGDAFNYTFTPGQLFTDQIVPGQNGTSAGGPNWVEFLTSCFSGLPSGCSSYQRGQKQLWDFAFAGADVSTALLPLHHNFTVSLEEQVGQWNFYARPYLPLSRENTLVAFWIGINDVGDSAKNASVASFPEFYGEIVGRLFAAAGEVAQAGYRDFLFMGLPPLEKTPGNVLAAEQGMPLYPNVSQVEWYDAALESGVRRFGEEHGVNGMFFDTRSFLNGVIEEAERYGIKNTTGICPEADWADIETNYEQYGCLPIDEYFWFNSGHITSHVHEILTGGLREFLESQR